MGTNWNTGSSVWTYGNTFLLWGWQSTSTGCPDRLWSHHLWRHSKAVWTCSWSTLGGAASAGLWTRWPPEVPSNLTYAVIHCSVVIWCLFSQRRMLFCWHWILFPVVETGFQKDTKPILRLCISWACRSLEFKLCMSLNCKMASWVSVMLSTSILLFIV